MSLVTLKPGQIALNKYQPDGMQVIIWSRYDHEGQHNVHRVYDTLERRGQTSWDCFVEVNVTQILEPSDPGYDELAAALAAVELGGDFNWELVERAKELINGSP